MTRRDEAVRIYTDGACSGNPGPGGWAALLCWNGREQMVSGGEPETTNNRMELTAAIMGLAALRRQSTVRLTTDSQYVQLGISQWLPGWRARGWLTAARKPVANRDLWERLDALAGGHRVRWEWVRGHAGHPENERVDQAARAAIPGAGGGAQ